MVGDVFLLGSNSWRIRRVEQGTVRVTDARGAPPTVPFWIGEAPARTDELSEAVSKLRRLVEEALRDGGPPLAVERVAGFARVDRRPATDVVAYLAAGRAQLGALPTRESLVVERFFDDTGGVQLVVHSPYGARVNRGLGLTLRKRFCRTFDFELQAAASDDAVVLSLGPQHSFALETVLGFLSPVSVREVLVQAVLPTPIFTSRWRWNLNRALVSPRFRGSRHLPPAIQRMEADDLMAAIFPMLAACQENVSGPIEIPDHPLVRQTLDDCCTEAMDLDRLVALLEGLRGGDGRRPLRRDDRTVGPRPRDPERPAVTRFSTTRPWRTVAPGRSRCVGGSPSRRTTSRRSTRRRSTRCAPRSRRTCATPTSSTTSCGPLSC